MKENNFMKNKQKNRNLWSKDEDNLLLQEYEKYP